MHAFLTTEILNNGMWVSTNCHVTFSQSHRQGLQASGRMDENDKVKVPSATRQINVSRVDRTMKSPAGTATRKKKLNKGATEICFMVLKHFSIGQCWCSGASVPPPLTASRPCAPDDIKSTTYSFNLWTASKTQQVPNWCMIYYLIS